ncbi:Modifier of mdg4 [Operophtera brumata]|uniref:Modifier of mdg4 n=1 Tax=Operophtera brumata TaxID=104452 RepID=A0A0L7KPT6_OPEBR|nr:Modifier of mdg4 [Operophtera brumata]
MLELIHVISLHKECVVVLYLTSMTLSDMTMTTSIRGNPIIVIAGYRFNRHRIRGVKTYWKCSTHLQRGCRAVIHTLADMTVIKCINIHNH